MIYYYWDYSMIPYGRRAMDKAFSSATHLIATFSMCFHSSELGSAHKKSVCRWQTLYQSDPGEELATQEQVKSERRTGSDGGERMIRFIGIIS